MVHLNITNKTKSLMTLANVLVSGEKVAIDADETISIKKSDLSKSAMSLFKILGDKLYIEMGTAVVEVNDNESVEDADDVVEEVNEPAPEPTEPQEAPVVETVESVLQEAANVPPPVEMNIADEDYWHSMYKDELVKACKNLKLDCGGTKAQLVERLIMESATELPEESDGK